MFYLLKKRRFILIKIAQYLADWYTLCEPAQVLTGNQTGFVINKCKAVCLHEDILEFEINTLLVLINHHEFPWNNLSTSISII